MEFIKIHAIEARKLEQIIKADSAVEGSCTSNRGTLLPHASRRIRKQTKCHGTQSTHAWGSQTKACSIRAQAEDLYA